MHYIRIRYILISILWLLTSHVYAETIYVIDELKIGLHQDRTVDSPIIKLVPSGTALTVIERDNDLVHVQESEGVSGWINSKYVINEKPGKARVNELEKEIELLKSGTGTNTASADSAAQKELEQQLNSERLKNGDLQAQLADLKASIANIDSSDAFLADIETLKNENEQLRSQLQSSGIEAQTDTTNSIDSFSLGNWKQKTTALIIVLIIGMVAGAFILDYLNRRRHGGFRV
jgi:SH3 domain protein